MTAIQIIKSPSGEELVVLPRQDYDRLIEAAEDAIDLKDAHTIMDRVAKGEEETYPLALIQRLETENRIKAWREYRGISQAELADKIGASTVYISQLETGRRGGSAKMLRKIAGALDVDMDDVTPLAD